jgi:hypothetical protein
VKHVEKHISRLLVSIAVLLVFGNVAFAAEDFSDKSDSSIVSKLQTQDQKPFIFNEIAIGEVSQTISQNEYLGLGLLGMFYSNQDFSFANVSLANNSSYFIKDKRELIFRHLFPFHFFW